MNDASIESVLLKGPGIATWLYAGDRGRPYSDTDLLLRKQDWDDAIALLREMGFREGLDQLAHPRMESGSGYPLRRMSDQADVDLHYTLFGIDAGPDEVWKAFAESAVREPVGGMEVLVPSHAARLLHVVLHAVQDGGEQGSKPMTDLEQALSRATEPEWREAFELASRLRAAPTFAAGLRLTPDGCTLAKIIGAESASSVTATLRLKRVPMAEGFQELAETSTWRSKLALARRELFPSPAFMRWWSPLARRGTAGLALAYSWRPVWLAVRAVPGYLAWKRAVRRTPNPGPRPHP
jgi:hypothetical protein